ncbi:MAG: hypothetical protein HYV63_23635 [Candidatus Schekmanbacteria bacterium]|nr:hypothetical protein [Candidatus Schekmanbacteria bacterium]
MRFAIRRDSLLKPLLVVFGAVGARSFVEMTGEGLRCRFGFLFDEMIPYSEIVAVERDNWPWYGGAGWRMNFVGTVALIGSFRGIVRIDMRRGRRARLFFRVACRHLFVSLERPDDFVGELSRRSELPRA